MQLERRGLNNTFMAALRWKQVWQEETGLQANLIRMVKIICRTNGRMPSENIDTTHLHTAFRDPVFNRNLQDTGTPRE